MAGDRYTLLVLDGELPPLGMILEMAKNAERTVCTDGVARHLEFLDPPVNAIIGDLDSLADDVAHFAELGIEIVHDPSQYSNDFEKALDYLIGRASEHVLILGLSGKRIDHTLTNISVMKRFVKKFKSLVSIDQYGLSYFVFGPIERHKIEAKENAIVSLTPIYEALGVVTENLYYPINGTDMHFGEEEGMSNIVTSSEGAHISMNSGTLMVTIVTNP
jgi:thiamine pyrophosphokinase